MRSNRHGFTFVVIVATALVGCQYDPWASGYATNAPLEKEIVGTYTPDATSRSGRIELPISGKVLPVDASAAILLSADHTAQFVNVPADFQGKEPCSITGRGSWQIGKNSDTYYAVYARIKNETKGSACASGEFDWTLMLYGKRPPYKLHQVIDDPDLGEVVAFEKHPAAQIR